MGCSCVCLCVSVRGYTALSVFVEDRGCSCVCLCVSVRGYTALSVFVEDRGCSCVFPVCFSQGVYSTVNVNRRQELQQCMCPVFVSAMGYTALSV